MKLKDLLVGVLFMMSLPILAQNKIDAKWKDVNGVSIPIPPSEHPRLYLRSHDIPELKNRINDPALAKVWSQLMEMKKDRKPSEIPKNKDWRYYVDQKGLTVRAELDALQYLVTKDKTVGRKAINSVLDSLSNSSWPEVQDIARASGRMMVTGAIVYDWCHDLLKQNEKEQFIKFFVRLAKTLECGYPPTKQGSITGHSSEWMIMRDLLSAGIAIYDDFPEMYNLTAARFFGEHLPARNWFYPGNAYHQGSSYDNVRFAADLFPLWMFDRMGAGNVYNPEQQFVMYNSLYKRRPDGQLLLGGDVNPARGKSKYLELPAMLAASYYKDEYLNYEFLKSPKIDNISLIYDLLWRDTKLGTKGPETLPLTKYFGSPYGWMIARTDWGKNSVIAEMKINVFNFSNHQHNDAGAFQIYYKGPLAIDSGSYQGSSGGYNSPHNKNYFKRTIAHNSLLIYDPNEEFKAMGYGGEDKTPFVANDGGQRLPGVEWGDPQNLKELLTDGYKTGEIIAHGFGPEKLTPDYTYLKGDITEAYTSKVKEVKRSFVFLNLKNESIPAAFIVFDKVVSKEAGFKKFWLLHSIEEPAVNGNEVEICRTKNGDEGKLINTTLLPKSDDREVNVIGGPGKEFWVFGKNYPNAATTRPDPANERGEWRVELSPKKNQTENYFLNVMQVMDSKSKTKLDVEYIEAEKVVGVQISNKIVTFSKDSNKILGSFEFSIKGKGNYQILLTDLCDGSWKILKNGKEFIPTIQSSKEDQSIYFEGSAGTYKLVR
jgi:hypothetical protein